MQDDIAHKELKFLVELGEHQYDEIMTYSDLSEIIERQHEAEQSDPDRAWIFKGIKNHQGPMTSKHPDYKGSAYNVLVQWEDG
jgi:uncharacterized cupin superfamily protein